jgi:hypothetical protein
MNKLGMLCILFGLAPTLAIASGTTQEKNDDSTVKEGEEEDNLLADEELLRKNNPELVNKLGGNNAVEGQDDVDENGDLVLREGGSRIAFHKRQMAHNQKKSEENVRQYREDFMKRDFGEHYNKSTPIKPPENKPPEKIMLFEEVKARSYLSMSEFEIEARKRFTESVLRGEFGDEARKVALTLRDNSGYSAKKKALSEEDKNRKIEEEKKIEEKWQEYKKNNPFPIFYNSYVRQTKEFSDATLGEYGEEIQQEALKKLKELLLLKEGKVIHQQPRSKSSQLRMDAYEKENELFKAMLPDGLEGEDMEEYLKKNGKVDNNTLLRLLQIVIISAVLEDYLEDDCTVDDSFLLNALKSNRGLLNALKDVNVGIDELCIAYARSVRIRSIAEGFYWLLQVSPQHPWAVERKAFVKKHFEKLLKLAMLASDSRLLNCLIDFFGKERFLDALKKDTSLFGTALKSSTITFIIDEIIIKIAPNDLLAVLPKTTLVTVIRRAFDDAFKKFIPGGQFNVDLRLFGKLMNVGASLSEYGMDNNGTVLLIFSKYLNLDFKEIWKLVKLSFSNNNEALAKFLNIKDEHGWTVLDYICKLPGYCNISKEMIDKGAEYSINSLLACCCYGNADMLKFILKKMEQQNLNKEAITKLLSTVTAPPIETLKLYRANELVDCDLNFANILREGLDTVKILAEYPLEDILKFLQNFNNSTFLGLATCFAYPLIVNILLEYVDSVPGNVLFATLGLGTLFQKTTREVIESSYVNRKLPCGGDRDRPYRIATERLALFQHIVKRIVIILSNLYSHCKFESAQEARDFSVALINAAIDNSFAELIASSKFKVSPLVTLAKGVMMESDEKGAITTLERARKAMRQAEEALAPIRIELEKLNGYFTLNGRAIGIRDSLKSQLSEKERQKLEAELKDLPAKIEALEKQGFSHDVVKEKRNEVGSRYERAEDVLTNAIKILKTLFSMAPANIQELFIENHPELKNIVDQ